VSGYRVGPTITEKGLTPWPPGWEQNPKIDTCAHEWESVLLGPPGHKVEEVVRCAIPFCNVPRCGHANDRNPCLLRRHHKGKHRRDGRITPIPTPKG
jgi:hypothetical protein